MSRVPEYPVDNDPQPVDLLYLVDVSDVTDDVTGSSKHALLSNVVRTFKIATVTPDANGNLDFTVPSGYKRIFVKGMLRSDEATTSDRLNIYVNGDTTDANYHSQRMSKFDGTTVNDGEDPSPFLANVPGSNVAANHYANVNVEIDVSVSPAFPLIVCTHGHLRSTTDLLVGTNAVAYHGSSAAITALSFRTNNSPTDKLVGELTMYGEQ